MSFKKFVCLLLSHFSGKQNNNNDKIKGVRTLYDVWTRRPRNLKWRRRRRRSCWRNTFIHFCYLKKKKSGSNSCQIIKYFKKYIFLIQTDVGANFCLNLPSVSGHVSFPLIQVSGIKNHLILVKTKQQKRFSEVFKDLECTAVTVLIIDNRLKTGAWTQRGSSPLFPVFPVVSAAAPSRKHCAHEWNF